MADRNEPVGARAGRVIRRAGEFFTTTEGERPAAGGAYSGMTVQEELEEAARARRELAARRAERAAARAARPSAITNRPVGGNLQAAQPAARAAPAAAAAIPAGAEANALRDDAARLRAARGMRGGVGEDSPEATSQRDAARPPAPEPAPAAAAPTGRRSGGTQRRRGELTADDLNAMVLDRLGASYQGRAIPATAGAVTARGNIERAMGYKKGGLVGRKAGPAAVAKKPIAKKKGGMVSALKAKTGRPVGRPASGVKPFGTQKMAAAMQGRKTVPMPAFKKGGKVVAKKAGGMISKGRKK